MTPSIEARPVVVVTGVSSGIGLAIAEELLQRGYRVCGGVRRRADADGLTGRWPDAFVPLVFDVTDAAALAEAVAQVDALLDGRPLKALINNAGVSHAGPLLLQPEGEVRKTFEVNVFGLLAVTRAFLPLLGAQRDAAGPKGRIVNIGSVAGTVTLPFMTAYSASKHAVEALSQGLRRELKVFGIEVCTIEPGFIRTPLFDKTRAALSQDPYAGSRYASVWQRFSRYLLEQEEKAPPADVVVRAVMQAIESDRPRTRYPLDINWHIGRWLPDRAFDWLLFKMLGVNGN